MHRVSVGAIATSAGILVSQYILSPIIGILNTRILGVETYGLFALASNIMGILSIFPLLGFHEGIIKFVPGYLMSGLYGKIKGLIVLSLIWVTLLGIGCSVLLALFTTYISDEVFQKPGMIPILYVCSGILIFVNYHFILNAILTAFKEIKNRTLNKYVYPNIAKIFVLILAWIFDWGLTGALIALVLATLVQSFAGWRVVFKLFPDLMADTTKSDIGKSDVREVLHYCLPVYLTVFVSLFLQQTDGLMIGYFRTASEVGIYEVAFRLTPFVLLPLGATAQMLQPIVAEAYSVGDKGRIQSIFIRTTEIITLITLPIILLVLFYRNELLSVFGNEFRQGAPSLFILICGFSVQALTGHTTALLSLMGYPRVVFWNNTVLTILNVVLNFFLIQSHGIIGAAIATAISIAVINICQLIEVKLFLKMSPFRRSIYKPYLAAMITAGIIGVLRYVVFSDYTLSITSLIIWVPGLLVVYGTLIYALKIHEDDKVLLMNLYRSFQKRMATK